MPSFKSFKQLRESTAARNPRTRPLYRKERAAMLEAAKREQREQPRPAWKQVESTLVHFYKPSDRTSQTGVGSNDPDITTYDAIMAEDYAKLGRVVYMIEDIRGRKQYRIYPDKTKKGHIYRCTCRVRFNPGGKHSSYCQINHRPQPQHEIQNEPTYEDER